MSANKRYSNRWSMNASFSYTWTDEFGNNYFNNRFGTAVPGGAFSFFGRYPHEPERAHAATSSPTGTPSSPARSTRAGALRVTPVLKMQSGAPYGRFFTAALNYKSAS